MPKHKETTEHHQGKRERYIQPSILMALYLDPAYGYQLIQNIQNFGFVEGQAPPGMIYRHLRQLEEEGLVLSAWNTEATGPGKTHVPVDRGRQGDAFDLGRLHGKAGRDPYRIRATVSRSQFQRDPKG